MTGQVIGMVIKSQHTSQLSNTSLQVSSPGRAYCNTLRYAETTVHEEQYNPFRSSCI